MKEHCGVSLGCICIYLNNFLSFSLVCPCRKVNKCYRGRSCPIIVHCRYTLAPVGGALTSHTPTHTYTHTHTHIHTHTHAHTLTHTHTRARTHTHSHTHTHTHTPPHTHTHTHTLTWNKELGSVV